MKHAATACLKGSHLLSCLFSLPSLLWRSGGTAALGMLSPCLLTCYLKPTPLSPPIHAVCSTLLPFLFLVKHGLSLIHFAPSTAYLPSGQARRYLCEREDVIFLITDMRSMAGCWVNLPCALLANLFLLAGKRAGATLQRRLRVWRIIARASCCSAAYFGDAPPRANTELCAATITAPVNTGPALFLPGRSIRQTTATPALLDARGALTWRTASAATLRYALASAFPRRAPYATLAWRDVPFRTRLLPSCATPLLFLPVWSCSSIPRHLAA